MGQNKVLVIEDEAAIRDMLKFTLTSSNYLVSEASNAEEGWKLALNDSPDLILLDWMMPGTPGIALVQRLRQNDKTKAIPIIMLTARGEEEDQVKGFDTGVDDFVIKPFSPRALIARIQALLRRKTNEQIDINQFTAGNMRLDLESHRFYVTNEEVKLGPTEFNLIHFFMSHPDRVFSRTQLLDHVWGVNVVVEERTVDVHIRRLRKLLESTNVADYIQTIRGSGYRFSVIEE